MVSTRISLVVKLAIGKSSATFWAGVIILSKHIVQLESEFATCEVFKAR